MPNASNLLPRVPVDSSEARIPFAEEQICLQVYINSSLNFEWMSGIWVLCLSWFLWSEWSELCDGSLPGGWA